MIRTSRRVLALALSAAAPALLLPQPTRSQVAPPRDRFDVAGGCFTLEPGPDGPIYFKATDLGRYLLYTVDGAYLAADGGEVAEVPEPTASAEWDLIDAAGDTFDLRAVGSHTMLTSEPVAFTPAPGCAPFAEVDINVAGPVATGDTRFEEVRGYLDGHNHMMAFESFGGRVHCGRPWHRFGVTKALVDCPDHEPANGTGAILENFLASGSPVGTHDSVGWPTFRDWPAHNSLTHEQTYYRWLERTWRGGLRIFVNLFVDNGALCNLYPLKKNSCDEMDGVRLQAQRIRELERYIDAQSGGPGEGWFRIVSDPFEARRVINEGKLAVVPGMEVSVPFGCRTRPLASPCTEADVDRQLDELRALGVRQVELVNKFDNALAGVAGDGGSYGIFINVGNLYEAGRFIDMQTCTNDDPAVRDNSQITGVDLPAQDAIFGGVLRQVVPPGALPVYPPPPHCNTLGLSDLGAHAIEGLAERHLLFDPDHMSVLARQQSLDVIERLGYPGVISSHSWATPDAYARIHALGGVVTPYAGGSAGFVGQWREQRRLFDQHAGDRFVYGIGYGADNNGFGTQGGPRGADAEGAVRYPFTGFGGVRIDRQVSGQRTFDVNTDGVAHYGLYPDWVENVRLLAGADGDRVIADLEAGAEAYLQMWERATGIVRAGCAPGQVLDALTPGMTPEAVLQTAGQPERRVDSSFTYCVAGGGLRTVAFDAAGRLATVSAGDAQGSPPVLPATGAGSFALAAGLLAMALAARSFRRHSLSRC